MFGIIISLIDVRVHKKADGTIRIDSMSSERAIDNGTLTIPETILGNPVSEIGGAAFADYASVERITIPDSVTAIGDYAFNRCTALKKLRFPIRLPQLATLRSVIVPH